MRIQRILFPLFLLPLLLSCLAATTQPDATATVAPQWSSNLSDFINTHPQHRWIVGTATEPALSADEAQASAEHDAIEQLSALLRPELRGDEAGRLPAALESSLHRQTDWIADRYVSATDRPYGTIWHAQILVMADASNLAPVVRQVRAVTTVHHVITLAALGIAILWLCIVLGVYLLLNWLSRGYFRLRLATMAIILILLGFAGLGLVANSI